MKFPLPDVRKCSGSIPHLPMWELVAVAYILFYGTTGLITSRTSERIEVLLGSSWGILLWYVGLTIASVTCLIGMFLKPPNGLVVNLAGMMAIFLLTFAVAVGMAIGAGTFFFSGNSGLWIFAVGGLLKSLQLFNTLSRLEKSIQRL